MFVMKLGGGNEGFLCKIFWLSYMFDSFHKNVGGKYVSFTASHISGKTRFKTLRRLYT